MNPMASVRSDRHAELPDAGATKWCMPSSGGRGQPGRSTGTIVNGPGKMKEIGLQPTSTGQTGGREFGQKMSDLIIEGGAFERSFDRLAATGWKLNLQSAMRSGGAGPPVTSKMKFSCSNCGQNAWGKPDLAIDCRLCGAAMAPA